VDGLQAGFRRSGPGRAARTMIQEPHERLRAETCTSARRVRFVWLGGPARRGRQKFMLTVAEGSMPFGGDLASFARSRRHKTEGPNARVLSFRSLRRNR